MKKKLTTLLLVYGSSILLGCQLIRGGSNEKSSPNEIRESSNENSSSNQEICKHLTWTQVKDLLKNNTKKSESLDGSYAYIWYCEINPDEVDELIGIYRNNLDELVDIYRKTKNNKTRSLILDALNRNSTLIQNNEKVLSLYKSVAASEDIVLVPVAIQGLAAINEVDEIVDIYKSKKEDNLRKVILERINNSITENQKAIWKNKRLVELYKLIATSRNRSLAPIALRGLINAEDDERWTDWRWSNEVSRILQEAVEKDFYKLSLLDYLELLALANKYPNSQFTKACQEYRDFTEGTYFGQDIGSWGGDKQAVFRQPFNPARELEFWPNFLKKYPDHPGSDDALYRIARAHEVKGEYETAILWYYKASQAPDGSMSSFAKDRILFLVDLLMSSDALTQFLKNYPNHPLFPYIEYSRAVHFIREDKLSSAQSELEKFLKNYQKSRIPVFFNNNSAYSKAYIYESSSELWQNLQNQINQVKEIGEIRKKKSGDESLYEEAAFWFHNDFIAYNHFWSAGLFNMFSSGIPKKWEGVTTSTQRSITYKLVETAQKGYELQNRYLRSIRLFEKLLKDYPSSELAAKAKYSIGLNYYYLYFVNYPTITGQEFYWKTLSVKSFSEFVKEFPNTSMADDALLAIAVLESKESESKEVAVQVLEKIVKDYPDGDRYKEAESMLKGLRDKIQPSNQSTPPVVGVGIRMEKLQTGNGILIQGIVPNSPASKSGLQSGDIIVQVDGQPVGSPDDVSSIVRRHQPGETVRFEIERQGQRLVVEVVTVLISL